jgi:outer membrane biogenesis lipoprotein LolB
LESELREERTRQRLGSKTKIVREELVEGLSQEEQEWQIKYLEYERKYNNLVQALKFSSAKSLVQDVEFAGGQFPHVDTRRRGE